MLLEQLTAAQTAVVAAPVRLAQPHDEDEVLDAVRRVQGDDESAMRHADGRPFTFSPEKTRAMIQRALIKQRNGYDAPAWIGIVGEPGQIQGSVYLSVDSPWCSDESFLAEQWNFVLPEYRHTNCAKLLLTFSRVFAKSLDLPLLIGVLSHKRTAAKCRLYARMLGQASVGCLFLIQPTDEIIDKDDLL